MLTGQVGSILLWLEWVGLAWPNELLLLGVASLLREKVPFSSSFSIDWALQGGRAG